MRDALSLLDQAIAYGHGSVNRQDVNSMLGSMAQDDLIPLLEALATQDGNQVFAVVKQLAERAPDFTQVLDELASMLHNIAVCQIVPDSVNSSDPVAALSKRIAPEDIQLYYQIVLLGRRDLALAPTPQQGFEMTMIRMLAFQPNTDTAQAKPIVKAVKQQPAQRSNETATPVVAQHAKAENTASPPSAGITEWRDMLPKLELTGMAYALAANCTLEKIDGNKVELAIAPNHQAMLNAKLKERLTEALSRYLNQPVHLEINPATTELITPIKQQQAEQKQHLAGATQNIMQDPKVKQLIEMYDATVNVSIVS